MALPPPPFSDTPHLLFVCARLLASSFASNARAALFATGILTNLADEAFRQEVGNVGAQIDFRLVIFSALESTLSIGYAAAKEDGHSMDTEFMISLKIM